MARYVATKEGWDGRRLIQPGEVFVFEGKRGSWMVPCDEHGKPLKGEDVPAAERPVRAGASQSKGKTRNDLREECKNLGIKFPATAGAQELAELLVKHNEKSSGGSLSEGMAGEDPGSGDGSTKGVGGTGDQEVL